MSSSTRRPLLTALVLFERVFFGALVVAGAVALAAGHPVTGVSAVAFGAWGVLLTVTSDPRNELNPRRRQKALIGSATAGVIGAVCLFISADEQTTLPPILIRLSALVFAVWCVLFAKVNYAKRVTPNDNDDPIE